MKSIQNVLVACILATFSNLNAQDHLISFAATGASYTVSTVKAENLTRGTVVNLNGTDRLLLSASATGIISDYENTSTGISFTPNPMHDYSRMEFLLPRSGVTFITLYELSGKKIYQTREYLDKGRHIYSLSELGNGIYFITISSGRFFLSGRLISASPGNKSGKIMREDSSFSMEMKSDSKGTSTDVVMQYSNGDILKFTGISGDYSTIVTDSPFSDKTVTFNFVACQDVSGNKYSVVMIGSAKSGTDIISPSEDKGIQIWMGENLKTHILNDGTPISNVSGNDAWSKLTGPAYCWYNNEVNDFGALYNWHTVNTGKLCPAGWRVPTDDDWQALVQYLGGAMVAGGKLKETGTAHWNDTNSGATNSSGFTAFGGGWRDNASGAFNEIKSSGYWWTSTPGYISNACYRSILSFQGNIYGYMSEIDQKFGLSVRCLKNN